MYRKIDPPTSKSIPQSLYKLLMPDISYTFTNQPAKEESYFPQSPTPSSEALASVYSKDLPGGRLDSPAPVPYI
jgi:hypothetical protein